MFVKQFRSIIYDYLCNNNYPNINFVADSIEGSFFKEKKYLSAWIDVGNKKCVIIVAKIKNGKIEQPEMMEFVQF